jgi:transposase
MVMRPIGTAAELQRRRIRAVELVDPGESPDDLAHFLGCGRSSVYTWGKLAKESFEKIAARPHAGPRPRLDDARLRQLEGHRKEGAVAHGWPTELWTAARVAELIRRQSRATFRPVHARKILKRRLRWTGQEAEKRARERDEEASRHWRGKDLPDIVRKARRRGEHLVFLDESGFRLTPTVRRTFSPIGRTPILRGWGRHDRISAISCITVSPVRRRLGPYFQLLPDDTDVTGERMVEFLRELRRQVPSPMRIARGRGDVHDRSKAVRAFLAEHPSIRAEKFPGDTPEANPDEGEWQHTKRGRLANFVPGDTTELRSAVEEELRRLGRSPRLLASFIRHAGIPIRLPKSSR